MKEVIFIDTTAGWDERITWYLPEHEIYSWMIRGLPGTFKEIAMNFANIDFQHLWTMELFSSGNNAVKLNQIIVALIVIIFGATISKIATRLLGRRLKLSKHIDTSTAYVIQKIVFYILLFVLTFISLSIAGIPITIFTVLGGALAIGVGFGAQNLFNNLISSFIILFEQPIRIDDIVEIDNQQGRIEEIGTRRVRIKRVDGVDLLVPNSFFLEKIVTNWTLSNQDVRGEVEVGIAYGSDTQLASKLVHTIATEHPRVNKSPEPIVLFNDFGNSALKFSLLFWASVTSPMDLRTITSDIRYSVDKAFRENGVVIAFPQQDVHIDSLKTPLRVRLEKSDNT